jgi:DNA-binding protein H-NS
MNFHCDMRFSSLSIYLKLLCMLLLHAPIASYQAGWFHFQLAYDMTHVLYLVPSRICPSLIANLCLPCLHELCLFHELNFSKKCLLNVSLQSWTGVVNNGHLDVLTENPHATENFQTNHHGSEWVELFVREMMSASDIDDARARASRALEALEKSIMERAGTEAVHNLHKENVMLKEQLAIYLRENAVLKRAVAIQHERQKEFDERTQEVHSLKQLVLQYQEQIKTLEINNYALRVHLKQAQQNNSMPGRFPPDVF